jgi:uncharacterized protein (DUF2147 family)
MRNHLLATLLALCAGTAAAQLSPVGLWKTIDDETKQAKSLVRIVESGGVVSGRIEKLLDPKDGASEVCDKCTDERKGKPIVGLTILRNLKRSADDNTVWEDGDVLDPANGKIYRARVQPDNGGKELKMRGYIGPFYRTQVWIRVE